MKYIKRFLIVVATLATAFILINANTRFFKDVGKNIPFLNDYFPKVADFISDASDSVNNTLSHIPSFSEIIARITGTEPHIDADDVAYNTYYTSDTMLTFYPQRSYSVSVEGDILSIYGASDSENDKFLVYQFLDKNGVMLSQTSDKRGNDGKFAKNIKIPDNAYQLAIFTGSERYGEYAGQVFDYIKLSQGTDGNWELYKSPVYDDNVKAYEKAKSISRALKSTYSVCHDEEDIKNLAEKLTENETGNYRKALRIYEWVCENIYYDSDSIYETSNNAPYVASDVLEERRAVCLGYANLYAALLRSIGIPCNVVTGYALGVDTGITQWDNENIHTTEANHAWNEVYVDNRWVIVDTTWGSKNRITDGVKYTDTNISHLYFDSNLKFFSTNHKILNYEK